MSDEKKSFHPDVQTRPARTASPREKVTYDDLLHCNRCGFCTSFCPTYLATGDEGLSPRGRNQALRALMEGRLKDPEEAMRSFSTCLLCGICTSVCFAEVPTAKLMSAAREKVMASTGEPFFLKFVLRFLLPRPWLFEGITKLAFLAKRLGISRALNALGLLRRLAPQVAAADALMEKVPLRFWRDRMKQPPGVSKPDLIYFFACGTNCIKPDVGEAAQNLAARSGKTMGRAENVCCGLPGISYGDIEAARALARRNIERWEEHPDVLILIDDSSCAATVKEYPELFDDPAWRTRAVKVAARVRDITEWLDENAEWRMSNFESQSAIDNPTAPAGRATSIEGNVAGEQPEGGRRQSKFVVTYHDPCKARYGQKIVNPPRRILQSLPSVEYRELPEADQCCGGGGTYSFVQPELSRAVLDRKIKCIESTGADVVLTSSVSCLIQVEAGLRWNKLKTKALHIADFLVKI